MTSPTFSNQFPDIEADKSVGRGHFPIAYGVEKKHSVWHYCRLRMCHNSVRCAQKNSTVLQYFCTNPHDWCHHGILRSHEL